MFISPLFSLVSFVLSLLVSISLPYVKQIDLFQLLIDADVNTSIQSVNVQAEATGKLDFGLWGYCLSDFKVNAKLGGTDLGAINGSNYCTPPKLGYTFDQQFDAVIEQVPGLNLNAETLRSTISTATTVALVLHVVAAALALLTFLITLCSCRRNANKGVATCGVLVGVVTALLTTAVAVVDIVFIVIARQKLAEQAQTKDAVTANYGNGPWMMVAAAVAAWIVVIGTCCDCCSARKRDKDDY
ncbi:actin cortical patch SUR7/pH-response regulator pali [Flagelloscypha sp. PMI_526]|nr:actin cortical patch SUR7/pH-response regulator pali [Flagelloscypha sp. PMI_526]